MAIEMKYQFEMEQKDFRDMIEKSWGWNLTPEEVDDIVNGCERVYLRTEGEYGMGRMAVIFQTILKVWEAKVKEAQSNADSGSEGAEGGAGGPDA